MIKKLKNYLDEHIKLMTEGMGELLPVIEAIGLEMIACFDRGSKILVMGNGGSAADAQHLVAELVGRFVSERRGLPAIALTTDSSILTAVGNDYGFEQVFTRQVEALATKGDLVVGISTSGNSVNVVSGLRAAKSAGCFCVALAGGDGGRSAEVADLSLVVPSNVTAHVQEAHIMAIHMLCLGIDEAFSFEPEL
jgi:D-sedoheptulose 7-phosphate isomerase